ncbi:MAG TPA: hydroxyisourate hydrolase [Pseudonocardiaceae bacterium]|jgi:5-hydroxyisourate hydrolase|nr:hydroxyisourate hydrolase [Pseudonocardiaceae bacterium]
MTAITTHVLDTAAGLPAAGVAVALEVRTDAGWQRLGDGVTDDDGRVRDLGPDTVAAGQYRLTFGTGAYFAAIGTRSFFPEVTVTFVIDDPTRHHHVPLLLSPFAFSTYRGS